MCGLKAFLSKKAMQFHRLIRCTFLNFIRFNDLDLSGAFPVMLLPHNKGYSL